MDLNRREFVAAAAAGFCAVCLGGCQSNSGTAGDVHTGFDNTGELDPAAAEARQTGTVEIGQASDYPKDGVYDRFVKSDRLLVIRKDGHLSATSAICPHKAQLVQAAPGGMSIVCPKHGSRFDLDGQVTKGPTENPLPHYAISANGGKLTVDKGRKVSASDPSASVKV